MLIETFVFFDLETSGLPRYDNNRTKITELTLIAAARQDIENTSLGMRPLTSKLSMVFNPQVKIQAAAAALTGLTNSSLANQPIFKDRIASINSFLEDLPKPVCLVAHNGNSFDYKILRAEYIDANENLPANIYCVDSRWGFSKILKDNDLCYNDLCNISTNSNYNFQACEVYLTDDEDEWPELNTSIEEWQEIDQLVNSFASLSTPSPTKPSLLPHKPVSPQKPALLPHKPVSPQKPVVSRHKPAVSPQKPIVSPHKPAVSPPKPVSPQKPDKIVCTLSALYKRLLNKEAVDAHRAEADCLMLLECVVAAKNHFLPWADSACKLLQKIEPLIRR